MESMGPVGKGQFIKQTYHKKVTTGPDGRPQNEIYSTKAHGALGGGNRLVDRQQMYENSTHGIAK